MALLHRAQLSPTKLELLRDWLPRQPWFPGGVPCASGALTALGAYRFDDPDGEVSIETILVRVEDGPLVQVPLTYRAAPQSGSDQFFVGTAEHSVLGTRWVYDGCGDPVYVTAVTAVIRGAARQAEEYFMANGTREFRTPSVLVVGRHAGGNTAAVPVEHLQCTSDGSGTTISAPGVELTVRRLVDPAAPTRDGESCLLGTWAGQEQPVTLATLSR